MDDIDVILFTMGNVLGEAHDRKVAGFITRMNRLIESEDINGALALVDEYDLTQAYDAKKEEVTNLGYLAFLWGVNIINSADTAKSTLSGKTPNIVGVASEQVRLLLDGSSETIRTVLRSQIQELDGVLSDPEHYENTAQKAEGTAKQRILTQYKKQLKETAKTNGKGLIDLVASLNSSRLAAYGYMNEATLVGITHYRYNSLMDNRTSEVCEHLNNKVFPVSPAYSRLDAELRVNDSTEMREFAPWVKGNAAAINAFKAMSDTELMDHGWAYPPMHPHCRSTVEYVRGTIQVAGLEIPTAPQGLSSILDSNEIQALIRGMGTAQPTINLAKGMLLAGMSALEVMRDLAISAEALALIQAAIDHDIN